MIVIKIENLILNEKIKNYKELCDILDIKVSNGNTKKAQLKQLALYTDYHKEGNAFVIDKIKEVDKEELLLFEFSNSSKYIKSLSNIILTYLYKDPQSMKEIPLIKLLSVLGVTNNNYKYCNNYRKELSQFYDIQLASIYYFYDTTRNEFKRIIERCLNNLQSRSVLFWNKCIMIVGTNGKLHKADDEEKELILDTQKEILEYMKVDSLRDVMQSKKLRNEFNKLINKELNFKYFFAYDIVVGQKAIQIEYENILNNKEELNNNIIQRVNKIFSSEKYIENDKDYKFLIELLIDLETNDNSLEKVLKDKRKSNIYNYNQSIFDNEVKYYNNIKDIEETYLDTFDN